MIDHYLIINHFVLLISCKVLLFLLVDFSPININYQMSTSRQQAVRRLEPGSFEAVHGNTDIQSLKTGIYVDAQALNLLPVIALDADLITYQLQRVDVLPAPEPPQPAATAAVVKHYEIRRHAFEAQSKALATLKTRVLATLDHDATLVVEEPDHAALRRTVNDLLRLLTERYADMTNKELQALAAQMRAMRWDSTTDLTTFMADLAGRIAFLQRHQFAPTEGEQVLILQTAVEHVPVFAHKADAAFHMQHPNRADQTLQHLITVYERVYRNEYEKTTAVEVLTANQVQDKSACTGHDEPVLQAIMASARAVIRDTPVTPTMLDHLATEITKTVARCLRPLKAEAASSGGGYKGKKQPDKDTGGGYTPPVPPAPGCCPLHPTLRVPHTWDQCRLNPDKKA